MNKLNKKEIADSKTEIERESNKGSFKGNFSARNFPDKRRYSNKRNKQISS